MPRRVRPKFPNEWRVPHDPRLWVAWKAANEKLKKEEVYWVSTSGGRGRPHAAPVWGIWKNQRLYFETDPKSVKGRNLLTNPRAVVHLQDGLDTVIVEGKASVFRQARAKTLLRADYVRKYDYSPDWSDETRQVVFEFRPEVAHAWHVPKMHRSQVNFVF